ncbi:MAG: discoidin domain-containing protein, partial [Flavobacteriales bacterium]
RSSLGWARNNPDNSDIEILAGPSDTLQIANSTQLIASVLDKQGRPLGPPSFRSIHFNRATARPITLSVPPNDRYNEGGAFTLVDGITAQEKRVSTEWLGWKEGVTITVDLGSVQDISYIGIGALNETYSWIHLPESVDFFTSSDGIKYTVVGADNAQLIHPDGTEPHHGSSEAPLGRKQFETRGNMNGRYVRFTVQHIGKIPEGFPGAGFPAWLFLDEIEVR